MSANPKLVTIFGGSGFVGRYIARRFAKAGWRVRVAVRRPNEAIFVRPYGAVGQVEPILANIRDDASCAVAIAGADAVVNCVGTFDSFGKNNFDAVNVDGAKRIARLSAKEGVAKFVHISAIGADVNGLSTYAKTKGEGEKAIRRLFKNAYILRPSVIFGTEDQFFNRFANMSKLMPALKLVGGNTKFQPVYVDDVALAVETAILGNAKPGIYELGGPEVASFSDLIKKMLKIIRRKRLVINLPFFVGSIIGTTLDILSRLTGGLFSNSILTRDQVKSLQSDNVVSKGAKSFKDLGITPVAMEGIIEDYLYMHRPYGQYTELTESAKDLRA